MRDLLNNRLNRSIGSPRDGEDGGKGQVVEVLPYLRFVRTRPRDVLDSLPPWSALRNSEAANVRSAPPVACVAVTFFVVASLVLPFSPLYISVKESFH